MHSLEKHPLFDGDLEESALWYGTRNPAVATQLINETSAAIRQIVNDPRRFPIWRHEMRRIRLRHFPHSVFYEIRGQTIYRTALAHGARDLTRLLGGRQKAEQSHIESPADTHTRRRS